MTQNNGSKQFNLPNTGDNFQSLEVPCSTEPMWEFLERFTKSQMDFVLAMTRLEQQPSNDSNHVRGWLMSKAKQYDNRLKPLNSRLESRSNDELLEFITTCATGRN